MQNKKRILLKTPIQFFNIWKNMKNISKTAIKKNLKKVIMKSWKCVYTSSYEKLFQRWKVIDVFIFEKSWVFKVESTLRYGFDFNDDSSTLIQRLNMVDHRCNMISTIPQGWNNDACPLSHCPVCSACILLIINDTNHCWEPLQW